MSETATNAEVLIQQYEDDTMTGKFLAFHLEQQFAIAISFVVDIINVQSITRVPNCPPFVKGITNLRGKVIPIVDMRLRLNKEPREYTDRTCIIVVEDRGMQVGFIVDSVAEVINLTEDEISPPPSFGGTSIDSRFIEGVGKGSNGITLLMNCRAVLDDGAILEVAETTDESEHA